MPKTRTSKRKTLDMSISDPGRIKKLNKILMKKTRYLRMIFVGIGFGLIAILIIWTLEFWQNSINGPIGFCGGKGACKVSSFYCPTFKHGPVACSFREAFTQYVNFTAMAIALLPITLTRLNLYFYTFYSTIAVAFLAQLYSYKVGIKWKNHLKNQQS